MNNSIYTTALLLGLITTIGTIGAMNNEEPKTEVSYELGEGDIKALIDDTSSIDAQDIRGYTDLIWACQNGNNSDVEQLIKSGTDLNIQNYASLHTALMMAVVQGYKAIVEKLLKAQADLTKKDSYGRTAYVLAKEFDLEEIAQLLLDAGSEEEELDVFYESFESNKALELYKKSQNTRKKFIKSPIIKESELHFLK